MSNDESWKSIQQKLLCTIGEHMIYMYICNYQNELYFECMCGRIITLIDVLYKIFGDAYTLVPLREEYCIDDLRGCEVGFMFNLPLKYWWHSKQ